MIHKKKLQLDVEPKVVGQARNQFGTRLCQRITCCRCLKVDHVSVRVANNKKSYCRACAENLLKTFDVGRKISQKTIKHACTKCHRMFDVSQKILDKKDEVLCLDCLRGFDVWRGHINHQNQSAKTSYIGGSLGSNILLRKGCR